MYKLIAFIAFVSFAFATNAQSDRKIQSKITEVTVFLNRAQVTRNFKTKVESGKMNLIVEGLTANLDQESIQVSGKGKFTILGISHQQNFSKEFASVRTKPLRDSIELLQQQILLEQSQKEILSKEEQMLLSNQKIGGANQNLTVAELKGMADFYRARLSDIIMQRSRYDARIKKLNEQLGRLQMQLREFNELYSRNTSEIIISVSADAETAAEFEVTYIVGNAGWIPVYDLRASDTKNPVQLTYKANVFQGSGEDWKNVKLTLSTANPSLGGVKPELSAWFIDIYKPVVMRSARYKNEDKKSMAAPAAERQQEMLEVASEEDVDAQSISNYTTTIQTSLNTEFNISLPYTVNSSNKPTLVDIASHSLKADYLYSAAPKLDKDAFLMARITGWEDYNLLPGEANVFFEGTFVTKSFIDPNSIKDTLSVSLGRDKRIVVQREKQKDFSSRKTIGMNQRESYGYSITVRNLKAELIKIIIEDQVPVSQNSQVEVLVTDTGSARYQKDNGKLTWELSLKPQETRKLEYKFEIKYPKDKIISDLH